MERLVIFSPFVGFFGGTLGLLVLNQLLEANFKLGLRLGFGCLVFNLLFVLDFDANALVARLDLEVNFVLDLSFRSFDSLRSLGLAFVSNLTATSLCAVSRKWE